MGNSHSTYYCSINFLHTMKKFDMTIFSFNEVEPVSLENIKGGSTGECCEVNYGCYKNTPPPDTPPTTPPPPLRNP